MTKKSQKQSTTRSGIQDDLPIRIMPWWWSVIATATSLLLGAGAWFIVSSIAKNDASLKIEAIKVGLSVTAGVGAASALLLAFRRQIHNEYVAQSSAFDATQRRVTELYTKAVEQLGHDKAAVRLGGLYALERLGEENPNQRQTVTDVVCAYLRMPYDSPPTSVSLASTRPTNHGPAFSADTPEQGALQQELLVRMAAQQLLVRHLEDPELTSKPLPYWGVRIDLRGARLINLNFLACRFNGADFTDATFSGDTVFEETSFEDECDFTRTHFEGDVVFGVEFDWAATFTGARFSGNAKFNGATIGNDADFEDAYFCKNADFRGVKFSVTTFEKTQFKGAADFRQAFFRKVSFKDAQFTYPPDLTDVTAGRTVIPSDWPDGWIALPSGDKENNLRVVPTNPENQRPDGPSGQPPPSGKNGLEQEA